jgi:hypothetical protein
VVGRVAQCLAQGALTIVVPLLQQIRPAEARQQIGVVRRPSEQNVVVSFGVSEAPLVIGNACQLIVSRHILWIQAQNLLVTILGDIKPAGLLPGRCSRKKFCDPSFENGFFPGANSVVSELSFVSLRVLGCLR